MKKYVLISLLLTTSAKGFSQISNADTMAFEVQTVSDYNNDASPYGATKDYNPKDYPNKKSIDLNCIVGDYWSNQPAVYTSAEDKMQEELSDSQFAFYKFYNDSTFDSQWGDWREKDQRKGFSGKYELFDEYKIIFFDIKNSLNQSTSEDDVLNPIPTGVRILEVTDSTVTFIQRRFGADLENKTITMYRHPGCMADQQWEWQDEYDNQYSLLFTDNGFFEYWSNRPDKNIELGELLLQGQYHLHNDVLYLEIIMATGTYRDKSREKIVKKIDPVKRTYVLLNLEKNLINSSDLDALHKAEVDTRGWIYEDCKYKTDFPIIPILGDKWMKITKVKIEKD